MKSDIERIFNSRVQSMVENTDFEKGLKERIKEAGLDKAPEFEFLREDYIPEKKGFGRTRNSRMLKIAGFTAAVFIVSSLMTIAINSEFAMAGRFNINNVVFSIKNGIFMADIHFETTHLGKELLIENEHQIPIGKSYLAELKIPGYIPEGYRFASLHIINNPKNEYVVMYVYEDDRNGTIMIKQASLSAYIGDINIIGIESEFFIGGIRALQAYDVVTGYRSAYIFSENEVVHISGKPEYTELIKIFEALE